MLNRYRLVLGVFRGTTKATIVQKMFNGIQCSDEDRSLALDRSAEFCGLCRYVPNGASYDSVAVLTVIDTETNVVICTEVI